ncbi:hypothetical protein ACJMK2_020065, partial [Sinanodonta woodiana]
KRNREKKKDDETQLNNWLERKEKQEKEKNIMDDREKLFTLSLCPVSFFHTDSILNRNHFKFKPENSKPISIAQ